MAVTHGRVAACTLRPLPCAPAPNIPRPMPHPRLAHPPSRTSPVPCAPPRIRRRPSVRRIYHHLMDITLGPRIIADGYPPTLGG
jgi:hypothetical protein